MLEVPTDDEGMLPDQLERILNTVENIKMIYTIPDFQNPSGRRWSLERRIKFMEIVHKRDIPVLEDAPYSELCFEGKMLPSLKSLDRDGCVIYLGTFSKVFCPGMRIGWWRQMKNLRKICLVRRGLICNCANLPKEHIYVLDTMTWRGTEKICAVYRAKRCDA